jgi:FkbM family methyltransferase
MKSSKPIWATKDDWQRLQSDGERQLVFDIGACRGEKTSEYVKLGYRVLAVEPNFSLCKRLSEMEHVTVVNKAIGAESGIARFMLCRRSPTISTCNPMWKKGRFNRYQWDEPISVDMTTLDALITEYGEPVFIKIDVEGMEHDVLEGLSHKVRALSFEFACEFLAYALACIKRLSALGYREFYYCLATKPTVHGPHTSTTVAEQLYALDDNQWGDVYAS